LIRILLLWWLISAFIKWLRAPETTNDPIESHDPGNFSRGGMDYTGPVTDVDFEEIEKER
jgi:hypothetical protein